MTDMQIRLTDLARRLDELLRGFVPVETERLLVGLAPADDRLRARPRPKGCPDEWRSP
jgi:hypothetical protein